jgi:thiol-disulfide isomerase/thioredoxin
VGMGRGTVTVPLLVLLLAGCSADPTPGPGEDVTAALSAQQEQLSARALRTLESRTCDTLPEVTRFRELPAVELACLGSGPARPVNAGDGRPTVINLWASWCAPCVREMPLLQSTAQRAGDGVRFVGIATQDERASGAALLEATGVRYDQYDDPDGAVRSAVRAVGLPVTLVYDAEGREVGRRLGEIEGRWLDDILGEAGAPLSPPPSAG